MLKKNKFLEQAEHNKELCFIIRNLKSYNDWVATTAFYSSLHFVKYRIFPLDIYVTRGKIIFSNFEDYHSYLKKYNSDNSSAHKILAELVLEQLPVIHDDYDYLLDMSWQTRYNFFQVKESICKNIISKLENIEKHCSN